MNWKLEFALLSCAVLGMRHGFDYDHLAAITDITAVQQSWKNSVRLGLLYAVGHALTVIVLGVMVVFLRVALPARLDNWSERLIGVTLIVLGLGVIVSLVQNRSSHEHTVQLPSRWVLLIGGIRYAWWRMARVFRPNVEKPNGFTFNYSGPSVFGIGMLHGIGAETPSQLMLFLLTASLGGPSRGFMGLLAFGAGLVTMNAFMTACIGGAFRHPRHGTRAQHWVIGLGAVYSLLIGTVFVIGASGKLPQLGP